MTLSETEKCELVTNCDRFSTLKQSQFDSLSYQLLPENHLRGVTKMVKLGCGAERPIEDFMLIMHLLYHSAMDADTWIF